MSVFLSLRCRPGTNRHHWKQRPSFSWSWFILKHAIAPGTRRSELPHVSETFRGLPLELISARKKVEEAKDFSRFHPSDIIRGREREGFSPFGHHVRSSVNVYGGRRCNDKTDVAVCRKNEGPQSQSFGAAQAPIENATNSNPCPGLGIYVCTSPVSLLG